MSKGKNLIRLFIGIGILMIPVVIYLVPPEWLNKQHTICLFRNLTGHECYGCGMTRAIFSAIHLRFADAVHFNKLSPFILPLLGYIWAKTLVSLFLAPDFFHSLFPNRSEIIKSLQKRVFLTFYKAPGTGNSNR